MKKNSVLKVLIITFLLYVIASWFIKGGIFYQGNYYPADAKNVLGIGDIFSLPYQAFYLFAEYGAIFLIIGGFYGILNATGTLHNIVKRFAKILKNKKAAIIVVSFLIMAFESLIGSSILTFIFVPFFALVLNEFDFRKSDIMFATIGSLLLGSFASTLGFNQFLNSLAGTGRKSLLLAHGILFVVTFIALVVTLLLKIRKNKEEEKIEFNYVEGDKKGILLMIILVIATLVGVIGVYNFKDYLGISVFSNFYNSIAKINVFNGMSALGAWSTKDIAALLLIVTLIISILYRIKFKDVVTSFGNGAKRMFKVSIFATLTSMVFMYYYNSETGYNAIDPIINFIYSSSGNYLGVKTALATPIYMILLNNPLFLASNVTSIITALTEVKSTVISSLFAFQLSNGISSLIIPTSYILIAGLTLFKISYFKWLKYIWKLLLVLVLISGIIILI